MAKNKRKTLSREAIIAIVVVALFLIAFVVYFIITMREENNNNAINNIPAQTTTPQHNSIIVNDENRHEPIFSENSADENDNPDNESSGEFNADFDISVPIDFIDPSYSDITGLNKELNDFDEFALTALLDGVKFKPGRRLRDITDTTYWYCLRDDEILSPGEQTFVCLENDFWTTDDIKIYGDKNLRNGDIFVWLQNYTDEDLSIRECRIYKYQINFSGCYDNYSERPDISYHNMNEWGLEDIDDTDFGKYMEWQKINNSDYGEFTRYTYGSMSKAQLYVDVTDNGITGITVSCNSAYGPYFTGKDVTKSEDKEGE